MIQFYSVVISCCIMSMLTLVVSCGKNAVLEKANNLWFRIAFVQIALGAALECAACFMGGRYFIPSWLVSGTKLLEFIITPAITLPIMLGCGMNKAVKPLLVCVGVHTLIELVLFPFNLIIDINEAGEYCHGSFYWIYMIACLAAFVSILILFVRIGKKTNARFKSSLIMITATFLMGEIPAMMDSSIKTGYLSITIVSIMLYNLTENMLSHQLMENLGKEQKQSTRDVLTGISNRKSYEQKTELINGRIRAGDFNLSFAVCECDLNDLKVINDTYGHESGDYYIKICCKAICNIFKHSPVFRVGGDEFVILMMNEDYENYDELKKNVLSFIDKEAAKEGSVLERIYFAAGFSKFNGKTDKSVADVLNRADFEMYSHKQMLKSRGEKEDDA